MDKPWTTHGQETKQALGAGTWKSQVSGPPIRADDGIRTRDPHLGKKKGGQCGASDLRRSAEMSPEQGFCISSPPVVPHGFSSSDGRMTGTEASSTASVARWSGGRSLQLFLVPNQVDIEVVDASTDPSFEHRGGRGSASWTLISNPARAQLARSTCASPVPAPLPGSSP